MKTNILLLQFVILVGSGCSASRSDDYQLFESDVIHQLRGCWSIQMDKWIPESRYSADTIFVTPPERIEFIEQRMKFGWRIHNAFGAKPSVHDISYCKIFKPDSLYLVWSTGYSGLDMTLGIRKDTLEGVAETFWDFGRSPQKAKVLLIRGICLH